MAAVVMEQGVAQQEDSNTLTSCAAVEGTSDDHGTAAAAPLPILEHGVRQQDTTQPEGTTDETNSTAVTTNEAPPLVHNAASTMVPKQATGSVPETLATTTSSTTPVVTEETLVSSEQEEETKDDEDDMLPLDQSSPLAPSLLAARAWLETLDRSHQMAAFGVYWKEKESLLLQQILASSPQPQSATMNSIVSVQDEQEDGGGVKDSDELKSKQQPQPLSIPDNCGGDATSASAAAAEVMIVGDEEDTAATSRSGSTPETTEEKETDSVHNNKGKNQDGNLATEAQRTNHADTWMTCWKELLHYHVVVFPCVWKRLEQQVQANENDTPRTNDDDDDDNSSNVLYATLDGDLVELLQVLDELCLHLFQRRFLEESASPGPLAASKDDQPAVHNGAVPLLKCLESAVRQSFDKHVSDEDEEVNRIKRILDKRQSCSRVEVPLELQKGVVEESGTNQNDNDDLNGSGLIWMPLAHLQCLLTGKHSRFDSWKQVNASIEAALRETEDVKLEEGGKKVESLAPDSAIQEEKDAVKEFEIEQNDDTPQSGDSPSPTPTAASLPLSPVASKEEQSDEVKKATPLTVYTKTPSNNNGGAKSSSTYSNPSNKKKKKKKGKKKKNRPSTDNKTAGTPRPENEPETPTAKSAETVVEDVTDEDAGERIPEQQQPEESTKVVAAPSTESPKATKSDISHHQQQKKADEKDGTKKEEEKDGTRISTTSAVPAQELKEPSRLTEDTDEQKDSRRLSSTQNKAPAKSSVEHADSTNVMDGKTTKQETVGDEDSCTSNPSINSLNKALEITKPANRSKVSASTSGTRTRSPLAKSQPSNQSTNSPSPQPPLHQPPQQHNESEWETVSTRSRGRKNKSSNLDHHHGARNNGTQSNLLQHQGNHKNNTGKDQRHRTTNHNGGNNHHHNNNSHPPHHTHASRRKHNASKKIVREIMYSVLDAVDDEVRNKQDQPQQITPQPQPMPWSGNEATQTETASKPTAAEVLMSKKPGSLQQKQSLNPKQHQQQQPTHQVPQTQNASQNPSHRLIPNKNKGGGKPRYSRSSDGDAYKKTASETSPSKMTSSTSRSSGLGSPPADQSTAPTYQETVSALSSTSNTVENGINAVVKHKQEITYTNGSAPINPQNASVAKIENGGGSIDAETVTHPPDRVPANNNSSPNHSLRSPVPPLPTLLSPENANSTTSSVASSLEAPHGRHHHLHHAPSPDDHNAVGYHLLDVCDRLSQDIALFMKSRAQAVSLRRNERAVLLGALQEVVSGIWSNACRVELYGSCATLLDLPSSDLDVVIIGLDNRSSGVFSWKNAGDLTPPTATRSKSEGAVDESGFKSSPQSTTPTAPPPPYIPVYSANAHRVMRLSAAIERLPWAVQVKSIPNATVPVIKILADPSKIPGFSTSSEWQGYSTQSAEQGYGGSTTSSVGSPADSNGSAAARAYQPWRGSDLMNGLISLDITFQGPEHGGIGSTDYSWHVVNRFCQEMGIPNSDDTPFVQCLMVLKELLVQRKLNEPYSGGLSSYALLLLLTALMRERAAIRGELERVEQHRQTASLAASGGIMTPAPQEGANSQQTAYQISEMSSHGKAGATETKSSGSEDGRKTPLAKGTSTSWASVARNSEPTAISEGDSQNRSQQQEEQRKPISFADVVGKSSASSQSASTFGATKDMGSVQQTAPSPQKSGAWQTNKNWERRSHQGSADAQTSSGKAGQNKAKNPGHHNSRSISSHTGSENGSIGNSNANDVKSDVYPHTVMMEHQFHPQQQQYDPNLVPSFFPQGFDDVIEVLCLGETTSGKLLMHFLLHYGQYFDASTTAIDISGKHERVFNTPYPTPYSYTTPFIERSAPESIDPHTGMLVVDHIVIYDPLEGAEKHNVARRCFAWHQVRWIFAQSYATLSSAVEKSAASRSMIVDGMGNATASQTSRITNTVNSGNTDTLPGNNGGASSSGGHNAKDVATASATDQEQQSGDSADLSSPLLRCLLSF